MTLIQRIHALCVAIGNDLKTLKAAVDKNTAVNGAQDKNIKVSLEDPERVKIVDFYHYDTISTESYLASGMTSLRLYHDKVYRLYFHDATVSSRHATKNNTILVFKLNHNKGGVIQLGKKPGTILRHNTLNYYPCTISANKRTLTKIPVFNQEENLYFIPNRHTEFAISFENSGDSHKEFRAIEFFLNDQKYEVFLSKYRLPHQFSTFNQPKPDFGIIRSFDNATNLIRMGNPGKENFSQFDTNPINFGRAEFYTRDSWADKQLDDYYYWDKTANTYTIQMTLSQSFSEYNMAYAYIMPCDPDGLPIYAHTITEREPFVLLPESTPTRLVISDKNGSGLISYFNSIDPYDYNQYALIIGGARFIEENGELKITDTHLCGAKINRQLSRAVIAKGLRMATDWAGTSDDATYTIDYSKNQVIIELRDDLRIPEPILKLMERGFSITQHDASFYFFPEIYNTVIPETPTSYNTVSGMLALGSHIPETPTPYNITISTVNPYQNNNAANAYSKVNRVFQNYAHYFKIGFLVNRFSGADLSLEEYIEEQGKPLQFTIHSMKMSVNY